MNNSSSDADDFQSSQIIENQQEQHNNEKAENASVPEQTKPELHPKATKYIQELLAEKISLDHIKFPHAVKLIDLEIQRIEMEGRAPPKESKYLDLLANKPVRVTNRVLIPVKKHPTFNFIGKILGPKGNSLRNLQEETLCRILIQGQGSMRDPKKEQELLNSLEPKYKHLADELNIEVSAVGAPAEAHARMAYALAELQKYLTPDNTDYISIEQLEQLESMREHGQKYQSRDYQNSATPFKRPYAASFHPDRFHETLNKAHASINNSGFNNYNYRRNQYQHTSNNYAQFDNSYAGYGYQNRSYSKYYDEGPDKFTKNRNGDFRFS